MDAVTANERELEKNRKIKASRKQIDLVNALRNRASNLVSLDSPTDSDALDLAVDLGLGFVPGPGTALSARDFERARRENDPLGMGLSAIGMIPVAGGAVRAVNKAKTIAKKSKEKTIRDSLEAALNETPEFVKAKPVSQEVQQHIEKNIPGKLERKLEVGAIATPEGAAEFEKIYGRKPISAMSEEERVATFGKGMAESPEVVVKDPKTGKDFVIPGGFDGTFTLADSAKISAQGIDYNAIDPNLAMNIHQKIVRSVDPGQASSNVDQFGRLSFGISSGNAPITKNLIEFAQLRPRTADEIKEWANYVPGQIGEQLPRESTFALNKAIAESKGVQSGAEGGTGVRNTSNYSYISDLAKMFEKDPEFFRQKSKETDPQFVERLINQVRGLGPKTGSLGIAMTNPQKSSVSAIDRHIADITYQDVRSNPATVDAYKRAMLNAYNLELRKAGKKPVKKYETARAKFGDEADDIERRAFRNVVSTPEEMLMRPKKMQGDVNPNLPEELKPSSGAYPFYEPEKAQYIPPFYQVALEKMSDLGKQREIGGFSNQWFDWDFKRSRAEPHAALNPLASSLKQKLTPDEYALVRDQFSKAGAFASQPDKTTGRLKPLKPDLENWKNYMYGKIDPLLLPALAGGSAATIYALRNRDEE